MLSALIHTVRSWAACYITTADQRHPRTVPLVLRPRSIQTTTRLVDIIQTVSRMLFHSFDMAWTIPSSFSFELGDRRISFPFLMENFGFSYYSARVMLIVRLFQKRNKFQVSTGIKIIDLIFPRYCHYYLIYKQYFLFWSCFKKVLGFTDMSRYYFSCPLGHATPCLIIFSFACQYRIVTLVDVLNPANDSF